VTITRRVRLVLAVLPWEFYESIIETLDILGDRRWSRHCERVTRTSNVGAW
jgi:hypothetical protein